MVVTIRETAIDFAAGSIGRLAYGKELREWPCYNLIEMRSRMFLWLSTQKSHLSTQRLVQA